MEDQIAREVVGWVVTKYHAMCPVFPKDYFPRYGFFVLVATAFASSFQNHRVMDLDANIMRQTVQCTSGERYISCCPNFYPFLFDP